MERDPRIPFTYNYSQPEEYHFSVDSIEMAWKISNYLSSNHSNADFANWKCLDLCSGCGVIGFEINFHVPQLKNWDFVEVQEVYRPHFEANLKKVVDYNLSRRSALTAKAKSRLSLVTDLQSDQNHSADSQDGHFQLLNLNYDQMLEKDCFLQKYQLIVCNPPYFMPGQGKLSPSEFKNRCRFFLDSSFENLIESILQSLAMDGEAFLLIRDLEDHQIDLLMELRRILGGRLKCENLDMVRGTYLLRIYR